MKTEEEIKTVINFYKSRKPNEPSEAIIFTQIVNTLEWVLNNESEE